MKCIDVQRSFDDLSHGRLPDSLAHEVQQHLVDCTDCRVQHQRAAKLERLLSLKRYERPAPAYFDNFVSEFHARLEEEQSRVGFWRRLFVAVDLEPLLTWRYGLATAACLMGALSLLWVGLGKSPDTDSANAPSRVVSPVIALAGSSNTTLRAIENELIAPGFGLPITQVAEVEPTIGASSPALVPAVAHHEDAPRYVLDHIIPATYEVSSVDF